MQAILKAGNPSKPYRMDSRVKPGIGLDYSQFTWGEF